MPKCDVTVTGVDVMTNLEKLPTGVEYAVLYSESSENKKRHPSRQEVVYLLRDLKALGHRCAVHICGGAAKKSLIRGQLGDVISSVSRIQVNGLLDPRTLQDLCSLYRQHTIIAQYFEQNDPLLSVAARNIEFLVDSSGGRGWLPRSWVRPVTNSRVGFAGGLTPSNVRNELTRIAAVARGSFWVDVESGVRDDDDWMDVGLVSRFVQSAI